MAATAAAAPSAVDQWEAWTTSASACSMHPHGIVASDLCIRVRNQQQTVIDDKTIWGEHGQQLQQHHHAPTACITTSSLGATVQASQKI